MMQGDMRMTRWRLGFAGLALVLALMGAPPAPGQPRAGAGAPDVTGTSWINSAPLTIGGLRGRVVLVEFWTYG